MKHHKQKYNKGSILLGTTILMLAIGLLLAMSVQFLGIGEGILAFGEQQSEQAFSLADTCIKESALRIERNTAWTGGSMTLGDGACTIIVTSFGSSRTVSAAATVGVAVRKITATMTVSGTIVSITSWAEDPS
ncbi:MAG: hypothetical protein PHV42_03270 [Candidatus Pacebacteria bacterium]|nr:hypothetical protein [Candidatus Paceibacterota bacterium]